MRKYLLIPLLLCGFLFLPVVTSAGTVSLHSYFNSCDPTDASNDPRLCGSGMQYFSDYLNQVATNPENYYFGYAELTYYAPIDAIRTQNASATATGTNLLSYVTPTGATLSYYYANGQFYPVLSNSKATVTYRTFTGASSFRIDRYLASSTGATVKYVFKTGSLDHLQSIKTLLEGLQNDNILSTDLQQNANTSLETRHSLTVEAKNNGTSLAILDTIEDSQFDAANFCDGTIQSDGTPYTAAHGAIAVEGNLAADANYVKNTATPTLLQGLGLGSIRDAGGAIKNSTDSNQLRLDVSVNSCKAAKSLGRRLYMPFALPKSYAVSPTFFGKLQSYATSGDGEVAKLFQAAMSRSGTIADRRKALESLFDASALPDNSPPTSGSPTTTSPVVDANFSYDGSLKSTPSFFSFQPTTISRLKSALAANVFFILYKIVRGFVDAATIIAVLNLFFLFYIWLLFVLSRTWGQDIIGRGIPFNRRRNAHGYYLTLANTRLGSQLVVISLVTCTLSACVFIGMFNRLLAALFNGVLFLYTHYFDQGMTINF